VSPATGPPIRLADLGATKKPTKPNESDATLTSVKFVFTYCEIRVKNWYIDRGDFPNIEGGETEADQK